MYRIAKYFPLPNTTTNTGYFIPFSLSGNSVSFLDSPSVR